VEKRLPGIFGVFFEGCAADEPASTGNNWLPVAQDGDEYHRQPVVFYVKLRVSYPAASAVGRRRGAQGTAGHRPGLQLDSR
jgi:hypothetical protein